jgi:hypothetical protein
LAWRKTSSGPCPTGSASPSRRPRASFSDSTHRHNRRPMTPPRRRARARARARIGDLLAAFGLPGLCTLTCVAWPSSFS